MTRRALLLTALLLFLTPLFPGAGLEAAPMDRTERILDFHSTVTVGLEGEVTVAERIQVYATGGDIRRGIVRVIPEVREDRDGRKRKVPVQVLSVTCNGKTSPYHEEREGDNKAVFTGSRDVLLNEGTYEYVIIYRVAEQVGFFDRYDEIYWNVTGNEWEFRICRASATVILPDGAEVLDASCYTGFAGSTDSECTAETDGNRVEFRATRQLGRGEGLTVAVAFPRDIVHRPPPPSPLAVFWELYGMYLVAGVCLLLLCCYFYFTWRKVGRDPQKPVVIPQFRPPHDFPPAVVRYLWKRGCDDRTFTAAVVSMAVKGALRIEQDGKEKYTLHATGKDTELSYEEQKIYGALFGTTRKSLAVDDSQHSRFSKANDELNAALDSTIDLKAHHLKNLKYVGWGAFWSLVAIVAYVIGTGRITPEGAMLFATPLVVILGTVLVIASGKAKGCLAVVTWIVLAIPSMMGAFSAITAVVFLSAENIFTAVYACAVLILYGIYVWLIKAPTQLGVTTKAEIEGFRMYLKTAEEHRLNMLTPPERTPELFERLLPYAIALDVENQWSAKFDGVLKKYNYEPDWYRGPGPFVYRGFAPSLGRSLGSSLGMARVDPAASTPSGKGHSWSSGSFGGGFSGGGGGGGGGRGW